MKKLTSACVALGLFFSSPKSADGQEESVAPILVSATANQSAETATRQGWPLLIIVSAMHRQLFASEASPVTIFGRDGSWSNAVKLEVQNSQGDLVTWPFHLAFTPTGSITLDSETVGELGWWLTPSETAGVPVGDYVITAVVDSTAIESPFASLNPASSVPVRVSMLAAKPTPTEEEFAEERLLLSDYYVLRGEDATALAEVDALLAEQPTHIVGLTYRAQLLRLGGQLDEALASYAAAVAAYSETSRGTSELPFRLLTEHGELQAEVEARTTYEVEVASKTPLHPYFEQGSTSGFLINGVEGGELWLAEDTTYTFRMVNVPPESPFYFSTNAVGSGAAPYGDGVTGQPASGTEEVTLTPGATTPDLLYYQSTSQPNMGWRIHILRGSASVGADMPPVTLPVEYHLTSSYPNPFRQETRLTLTVARPQRVMVRVFDVRGREVAILFDGDLPAGVPRELVWHGAGLTSGLFIVRVEGVTFSATRLVVLVK